MTEETMITEPAVAPILLDMGPRKVGDLDLEQSLIIRARQQSRAKVMGLFLVGLCVLFFAITFVRIGAKI
jgi:hypothetical protein